MRPPSCRPHWRGSVDRAPDQPREYVGAERRERSSHRQYRGAHGVAAGAKQYSSDQQNKPRIGHPPVYHWRTSSWQRKSTETRDDVVGNAIDHHGHETQRHHVHVRGAEHSPHGMHRHRYPRTYAQHEPHETCFDERLDECVHHRRPVAEYSHVTLHCTSHLTSHCTSCITSRVVVVESRNRMPGMLRKEREWRRQKLARSCR